MSSGIAERMEVIALKGVGQLLWPAPEFTLSDAERVTDARALVHRGDILASRYYRALLAAAYEGAHTELDAVREAMRNFTQRSA